MSSMLSGLESARPYRYSWLMTFSFCMSVERELGIIRVSVSTYLSRDFELLTQYLPSMSLPGSYRPFICWVHASWWIFMATVLLCGGCIRWSLAHPRFHFRRGNYLPPQGTNVSYAPSFSNSQWSRKDIERQVQKPDGPTSREQHLCSSSKVFP